MAPVWICLDLCGLGFALANPYLGRPMSTLPWTTVWDTEVLSTSLRAGLYLRGLPRGWPGVWATLPMPHAHPWAHGGGDLKEEVCQRKGV